MKGIIDEIASIQLSSSDCNEAINNKDFKKARMKIEDIEIDLEYLKDLIDEKEDDEIEE